MASSQGAAGSRHQDHSLSTDKFLTIAANLLYKTFFDTTRTAAKGIYRQLHEGRVLNLANVRMEDKSQVRFELRLDYSEYHGRLGFSAFRAGLGQLINNIGQTVKKPDEITTFTAEHDPRLLLFGVTGVTMEGEQPNVLALGADTSGSGDASVQLQLMYLDHKRFQPAADQGVA